MTGKTSQATELTLEQKLKAAVWMIGNIETPEDKAAWWQTYGDLWNEVAADGENTQAVANSMSVAAQAVSPKPAPRVTAPSTPNWTTGDLRAFETAYRLATRCADCPAHPDAACCYTGAKLDLNGARAGLNALSGRYASQVANGASDAYLRMCETLGVQASHLAYLEVDAIIRAAEARGEQRAKAAADTEVSAERIAFVDALVTGGSALERWERHTGVSTISDLKVWGERQLREVLMMRAGREENGGPKSDDLEEYLIGKQAALMPLLANLRQVEERIVPQSDDAILHSRKSDMADQETDKTKTAAVDRGPWKASKDGDHHVTGCWVESGDFAHDVRLYVNGDFATMEQRLSYAEHIARKLNAP